MPLHLRQSTASQEVPLGHFVDDADGKTAETALTINASDIKVWKAGATTLANKNSGGATHISGGVYYCVLDATDTDTIGPLVLFVAVSGALAVRVECEVLSAAVYDWLFGSTAPSTHSATDVWAAGTRTLTAGTNIVLVKGTGVTGFNDLSAAQVNAEADTALADVGLTTTITGRIDAAVTTRLAPSTAGRTLDVSATGGAGVDWSNVEAPTTTLDLSGTTVKAVTDAVTLPAAPAGYGSASGVTLDAGTVSSASSATTFVATGGTLNAVTGAYDGMQLKFESGACSGERRTISTHTHSGGNHTMVVSSAFSATPGAGDTFVIA